MLKKLLVILLVPLLCACAGVAPIAPTGAPPPTSTPGAPPASTPDEPPTSAPSEPIVDATSQSGGIGADEQAVYAVFFAENAGITVLRQATATDTSMPSAQDTADFVRSGLPTVSDETIDDYLKNNEQIDQLPADMNIGLAYHLLSPAEWAELSQQPDWGSVLKERYPGTDGFMFFSRVGFNAAHDQALLYVGKLYGPMAVEAGYYSLEKQDGQWRIVGQIGRVMA